MKRQPLIRQSEGDELTGEGKRFMATALQIDADTLTDRAVRCGRPASTGATPRHLAGTLGAAMMTRFTELKWAEHDSLPAAAWSISETAKSGLRHCSETAKSSQQSNRRHARPWPGIHVFRFVGRQDGDGWGCPAMTPKPSS